MNTSCELPNDLSTQARCDLVKNLSDVCEGGGRLAYTALVICKEPSSYWLVFAIFIVWLFLLFFAMTVVAKHFFTPNIAGIVSQLKISENIAGVTFMAFGNGAPDIFASLASVLGSEKPRVGLAIGGLLGGGIFVTTVVVGSMMLVKPFKVMQRPIMRDITFYLFAVAFIAFIFLNNTLHLWETLGFIVIYAIFALVVIGGRIISQRALQSKARRDTQGALVVAQSLSVSTIAVEFNGLPNVSNAPTHDDAAEEEPEWNFEPISVNGNCSHSIAPSNVDPVEHSSDKDITKKLERRKQIIRVFKDLLIAMYPIAEDEWNGNFFERIFAIIKAPVIIILKITNPQAGNHWSKTLAIIHCFACPMFAVTATRTNCLTPFNGAPQLWELLLIPSVFSAIIVLVYTSFKQEPRFFKPFSAFVGFIMSVFWIYSLANEVVGILQMVGVVSGLSPEVLGLTLLAWSNSLCDLVTDITVARRGFPKMAISAAFGGPLFNLLLGVGLPFTIAVLKNDGPLLIVFSNEYKVLLSFLGLSLTSTMVLLLVQRFYVHRWHGAYLLLLYTAFLAVILLMEFDVIF